MELMSARQAAKALGVSKAYACRLFGEGRIPAQKVDADWVVLEKDVRRYLDEKAGVPVYYQDTTGWGREDFCFLFRVIDKMAHNQRGRYDSELASIDVGKLNPVAKALLAAMGMGAKFENLAGIESAARISPPLVLSEFPTVGGFPEFERYGVIL